MRRSPPSLKCFSNRPVMSLHKNCQISILTPIKESSRASLFYRDLQLLKFRRRTQNSYRCSLGRLLLSLSFDQSHFPSTFCEHMSLNRVEFELERTRSRPYSGGGSITPSSRSKAGVETLKESALDASF